MGPSGAATTRIAPSTCAAPGDHVLDVVTVAGHVHVCIVTLGGFVFNVGNVDGDTTGFFFGGIVDRVECTIISHTTNALRIWVIAAVNVVLPWSM